MHKAVEADSKASMGNGHAKSMMIKICQNMLKLVK